jgi:hypothetical protein
MAYINIYFSVINLVDNEAIILKYALFLLKVLNTPVSLSHAYVLNNYYYYYDERKLIE